MITKQKILTIIIFGFSLVYANLTFAQKTPPPKATPTEEADEENFNYNKFGIGLFYNFADTPKLKMSVSVPGGSFSGDAEFNSEGALGLLLFGDKRFNKWWGLEYGVGYEFERTITGVKVNGEEGPIEGTKPSMTIFYFQLNGKFFPTDNFYILLGFNINQMDAKDALDLDLGYGAQIGLGYQISKNFAFEAQYQNFYSDYKDSIDAEVEGAMVSAKADGFSLEGVKLILRYSF